MLEQSHGNMRVIEGPGMNPNQVLYSERRNSMESEDSDSSNKTAKLSFSKDAELDELVIEEAAESQEGYQTSSIPRSDTDYGKP
jgi:hypothetical protein